MSDSVITGLVASLFGGSLVAIANHLFTRNKTNAEAKKLDAEADKIRAETVKLLMDMELTKITTPNTIKLPAGWQSSGSQADDYEMGVDHKVAHSGRSSGYIKSVPSAKGFGTLMQSFKAARFHGKRLRLSGFVKTENVRNWAGLWMRVDGKDGKSVSFDNMNDRPIKGISDWKKYEIVLDVPIDSINIAFGILLNGQGQVWIDDLNFEVVDEGVPTTDLKLKLPEEPVNLNFETE